METVTVITVVGTLGLIGIIFHFVGKMVKGHNELSKLKIQKEILKFEIGKQNGQN